MKKLLLIIGLLVFAGSLYLLLSQTNIFLDNDNSSGNDYIPGRLIISFKDNTVEEAEKLIDSYDLTWDTTLVNSCKGLITKEAFSDIEKLKNSEIVSSVTQYNNVWVYFNENARKKSATELIDSIQAISFEPIIYRNWGVIIVPVGEEQKWIKVLENENIVSSVTRDGKLYIQ